jgi:hypothetical protein
MADIPGNEDVWALLGRLERETSPVLQREKIILRR